MQIHELTNTTDLSSTDYVGVDNGTTTRRFDLGALIASIRSRLTNAETGITNLQTNVSDVQDDVADAQSDITGLGTRLDAAESSITSHGNRLTTAESDIDDLETKMTTAESSITTLQNNKVDMTTPLLNFDDTATDPLTDDGALANTLTALGILSDVIPSGGGMLYLKKALTEYGKKVRKLASNNPRFAIKYITITNFQIPDGTQSSPATVTIDLGEYGITDSIWSATVYIGSHLLPYIDTSTGAQRTWVSKISWRSVTITNTTSGWGSATLYFFVISNGTTV